MKTDSPSDAALGNARPTRAPDAPVIELIALSKWYGEVIGLNDVTAKISQGITGLLGANGAGKSTLMNLAMGQLRPSRGAIRVLGRRVWDNPAVLSQIGYCPEGEPFWSRLTGRQFVRFLANASGLRGGTARAAADQAIELTGMRENADRSIRGYSKGMRQRIKIAQALVHKPKLLILDEPFTGADPVARHHLGRLFHDLAEQGVDIVVSSHVLHEVEALTRQILLIDRGRVAAQGDLQSVRREMHDRPHTIRIRVDGVRQLAGALAVLESVTGLRITAPDTLLIETPVPHQVFERLPALVLDRSLTLWEVAAADESLEAVFGYLTRRDP